MTVDTNSGALTSGPMARVVAARPAASVRTASRASASTWLDRSAAGRWIALGLGAVAAVVTTWGIATPWPWSDEGATYLALQRGWTDLAVLWQGPDAPMVPYYYLAKAWAVVLGSFWPTLSTVVAVRLLSAAAGVATVVVLYALVARNTGRFAGVLAGLVLLSLPGSVRYAQEARPYALLALAATVSWLASDLRLRPGRVALGFRSLVPASGSTGGGAATGHALSLVAVGAIHTFGVFQWPAQLLAWLVAPGELRLRLRRTVSIVLTLVAATVLAGAQLAMSVTHGTGSPGLGAHRLVTPVTIAEQLLRAISMTYALPVSTVVVILALVGLCSRPGGRRELPVSLAIWLVVPLALALAVGAVRTNLFRLRYWVAFLPPLAALAALGIVAVAGLVVRLVWRARAADAASWSGGARVTVGVAALVLLAVQVATVLPAQRFVRSASGHSENLSGVFTAIADARAEHPGVRVVITKGNANGMIGAADPAVMANNPLSRIDPSAHIVYSTVPSAQAVRASLAGDRYLLWIRRGDVSAAGAARQVPAALADLHPTILHATSAGKGWTAVLMELPPR
ncbi:hypothetical protein [Micropruina sp.]|uniref:hypothetical protein n=1 Tax=Micropruina sp. TaxID=2737536 RepID=UPI0039E53384